MCTVVITKPDVNAMVDLGWSQVFAANLGYTVKKSRSQWERTRGCGILAVHPRRHGRLLRRLLPHRQQRRHSVFPKNAHPLQSDHCHSH